jgi:glycosyltransferase involved in cell wall biosynthesis
LRIAFITPFFPLKGGIARFSGLLIEAFRQSGYAVIPVAFRALYPPFLTRGRAKSAHSAEKTVQPETRLTLYNPVTWFKAIRRLRRLQPDLLLVSYWTGFLAPLCCALRYFTGIRVVVLLHNFSSHESFFFEPFMQRVLIASADGFLTLSAAVSRELLTAFPEARVRQLFHPVYEPEAEQPAREDARKLLQLEAAAPVLLFFGYVRPYKGLDMLLRALPALLHREPSLKLVVAGEFFEDPEHYRSLIRELGISGCVDMYEGYVSTDLSALLFAAADCVVLPYRHATQSGVVQQAYGYGRPVIVTPEGALPDMVRHGFTGWIARESSAEGVAAAAGEFLDGRGELPAMHAAIAEFSRQFSWEAFAAAAGSFLEAEAART